MHTIDHIVLGTSMATLRLELAKEETSRQEETMPHEMSPSVLLQVGLDLEDQQYVCPVVEGLLADVWPTWLRRTLLQESRAKQTLVGSAEIKEKRNLLCRRIQSWIEVRNIYVPALADDRETSPSAASNAHIAPELTPLKLPLSMTPALRLTCYQGLADIERRLRLAQAEDALYDLRKQLRITLGLTLYKTTQVGPSQRAGTRARALISQFRDKTMRCADRYRAAYSALTALDFGGEWCQQFRQLADTDIRPPRKEDDEAEGTRALSWIWRIDHKNGLSGACSQDLGPMGDEELSDCEYFCFEDWCGTNQYVQVFDANG